MIDADGLSLLSQILEKIGESPSGLPIYGDTRSFGDQFIDNRDGALVFGLSIPIFNGMANNTNVRRSKIAIQKSTYVLEQVRLDLENTINQAYNDAKGSLKAYQAAEKTLKARKLAYEYAKERFDNGGMNTFNFLQAGQRYEAAQSELIKTKYNYIFKLKVLEFYFGEASL